MASSSTNASYFIFIPLSMLITQETLMIERLRRSILSSLELIQLIEVLQLKLNIVPSPSLLQNSIESQIYLRNLTSTPPLFL